MGITLIDTAKGYGLSEERIGKHLAHRRDDFVLSSKVGYGIPGIQNWTYDAVKQGIEDALWKMNTDVIDIVHLHSCTIEDLKKGEVIKALLDATKEGKVRVPAYSGENKALEYALESGLFRSLQFSVNICDQKSIHTILPKAKEKGMGIIAKRPICNAPWRFPTQPHGDYAEEYWLRLRAMNADLGEDPLDTALRFTTFTYGVDSSIVGTNNPEHLRKNIQSIEHGKLHDTIIAHIYESYRNADKGWSGQV